MLESLLIKTSAGKVLFFSDPIPVFEYLEDQPLLTE